jgi:hypothetical protein
VQKLVVYDAIELKGGEPRIAGEEKEGHECTWERMSEVFEKAAGCRLQLLRLSLERLDELTRKGKSYTHNGFVFYSLFLMRSCAQFILFASSHGLVMPMQRRGCQNIVRLGSTKVEQDTVTCVWGRAWLANLQSCVRAPTPKPEKVSKSKASVGIRGIRDTRHINKSTLEMG